MSLTIKNKESNYLAKIVQIDEYQLHPNADKLKIAIVDHSKVVTNIEAQPGLYIYFQPETQLSEDYCKHNNLYQDYTKNLDSKLKGFIAGNRRVKCLKLREIISVGLLMPISSLDYLNFKHTVKPGSMFDSVNGVNICKKYEIFTKVNKINNSVFRKSVKPIDKQFKFHEKTLNLRNYIDNIDSIDDIDITLKEHGTSAIFCNLLIPKKLSTIDKIAKLFGVNIETTQYHKFCSSRRVIRMDDKERKGFYDFDIYKDALEIIKPHLTKGLSIYAEIVGYLPNGAYIQNKYDYGCEYDPQVDYNKLTARERYNCKLYKIRIYRISFTNVDGNVIEFSPNQLRNWCVEQELEHVAVMRVPTNISYTNENWRQEFLEQCVDFVENLGNSAECNNIVPEEGLVFRMPSNKFKAYKLKSSKFFEYETKMLDNNVSDIENEN